MLDDILERLGLIEAKGKAQNGITTLIIMTLAVLVLAVLILAIII